MYAFQIYKYQKDTFGVLLETKLRKTQKNKNTSSKDPKMPIKILNLFFE